MPRLVSARSKFRNRRGPHRLRQFEFLGLYLDNATAMGVTKRDIAETIPHLAFYIGWPAALSLRTPLDVILKAPKPDRKCASP